MQVVAEEEAPPGSRVVLGLEVLAVEQLPGSLALPQKQEKAGLQVVAEKEQPGSLLLLGLPLVHS